MHKALQYAQGTSLLTRQFTMHTALHYAQDSLCTRLTKKYIQNRIITLPTQWLHNSQLNQITLCTLTNTLVHNANTLAKQLTTEDIPSSVV